MTYLTQFNIPYTPILNIKKISLNPSLHQNNNIIKIKQPLHKKYLTINYPIKFSTFTPNIKTTPLLNKHTTTILQKLNYNNNKITTIKQNHTI